MLTSDGQTLTVNPVLPAFATLQVTVLKADSTAYNGVYVYLTTSLTSRTYAGTTDSAGKLTINSVPEGAFTVDAITTSSLAAGSTAGTVKNTDQGKTISITINAPLSGIVKGTVFAGDGATPIPNGYVYLYDASTNSTISSTSLTSSGTYQFNNVTSGAAGFLVRAYYSSISHSGTVAGFTSSGQTVTVNITLPVSVVSGTVYQYDQTTRVAYPSVSAAQNSSVYYAVSNDAQGHFSIIGIGQGAFVLTAQSGYLTGTGNGTLATASSVITLNVSLQAAGTVSGKVTNAAGSAVSGASVAVRSSAANGDVATTADQNGNFSISGIAVGNVHVQARDNSSLIRGSADGILSSAGGSVTINVVLPGTGAVQGTVYQSGGTIPSPNAVVTVSNAGNGGSLGNFSKVVTADSSGFYTVSGVPIGAIGVSAIGSQSNLLGSGQGNLTSGATVTVNVSLGTGFSFQSGSTYNLDGADGFRYDIGSTGGVTTGGKIDGSLADAYSNSSQTYHTSYGYWPGTTTGTIQQGGREIDLGPSIWSGLTLTRKVFSPSGGKFVRYLDLFTNTSTASITGTIYSVGSTGSNGTDTLVTSPSATSNQYAVTSEGGLHVAL